MKDLFKIIKVDQITDFSMLNLFSIVYENKKKEHKSWIIVSRNSLEDVKKQLNHEKVITNGVAIFAIHEETGKLVLLSENRISANDNVITLPAGIIEEGENIIETAKREFKEETGLELYEITEITKPIYSAIGISDERVSVVFGKCRGISSTDNQTDDENATIFMVNDIEAKALLTSNVEIAGRTYFLIREFILKCKNAPIF